jgi:hypothetical protein
VPFSFDGPVLSLELKGATPFVSLPLASQQPSELFSLPGHAAEKCSREPSGNDEAFALWLNCGRNRQGHLCFEAAQPSIASQGENFFAAHVLTRECLGFYNAFIDGGAVRDAAPDVVSSLFG